MNERIRVGVIGAGSMAKNVHLPSLAEMDDVELTCICDLVKEKAEALAQQRSIPGVYSCYKEMLGKEKMDAVVVLVEPGNLFHVVWNCLHAGFHTFMEKPPGVTCYQARTLARKARDAGRFLQVGFNRRFIPLVRHVREYVLARTRVTQVEGCFFKFGKGDFDLGSLSAFLSDTIHAVDLIRWLADGEPVAAAMTIGQYDDVVPNAWNGICRFDNGVTGVLRANYRTGGRVHQFQIHGPGLSAFINLGFGTQDCEAQILEHQGAVRYSLAAAGQATEGVTRFDGTELAGSREFYRFYGFFQELRHFVDSVRDGTAPESGIEEAAKSMALAEMLTAHAI